MSTFDAFVRQSDRMNFLRIIDPVLKVNGNIICMEQHVFYYLHVWMVFFIPIVVNLERILEPAYF